MTATQATAAPGIKIAHGAVAAKFSVNDSSGTENSPLHSRSNIHLKSETNGQVWDTVIHMRVASDGNSGRPQQRALFLAMGTKIAHGAEKQNSL